MSNLKNEKIILAELEYFFQGQFSCIGKRTYGNRYFWGIDSVGVSPDSPAVEVTEILPGGFQIETCSAVVSKKRYLRRIYNSIIDHLQEQGFTTTPGEGNFLKPVDSDITSFIQSTEVELEGPVKIWLHKLDPNFLFITWA